jgi:hypothetical protein
MMGLHMSDMTNVVLAELEEFRERLLPALAKRDPLSFGEFQVDNPPHHGPRHTLSDWQEAAAHLSGLLVNHPDDTALATELSRLRPFMRCGQAGGDYVIDKGVIHWRLSIFASVRWDKEVFPHVPEELQPESVGGVEQSRRAVRRWFERTDPGEIVFWNALCMVLPATVDDDPEFTISMLQTATYRERILSKEELTPAERQVELAKVEALYFHHVLNNAFLHIIAALANNHFMKIDHCLRVSEISGRYTDLLPHYLFAILFAKLKILIRLSNAGPETSQN